MVDFVPCDQFVQKAHGSLLCNCSLARYVTHSSPRKGGGGGGGEGEVRDVTLEVLNEKI